MGHRLLESDFLRHSQVSLKSNPEKILGFLKKYKWTIAGSVAVGSTAYYVWKILNSVPIRQILAIMVEADGKADSELTAILRGGEGMRLLGACLLDIRSDLSGKFDIQEKQTAARAPGNVTVQERLEAFKQLSICSFSRTLSAVYALCILNVFIHVQVFELVKHRRQGSELHDDAQRRFLSLVQAFHHGENSALSKIVERVEAAVKDLFESHSVTMDCTSREIGSIITTVRNRVGQFSGTDRDDGGVCTWMTKLMLNIVKAKIEILEASQWRRVPFRSSFSQETDNQLKQLLSTITEVLESELFADALAAAVNRAFQALETEICARGFVSHLSDISADRPPVHTGDPAPQQCHTTVGQNSVPLIKLVPVVSNLFGTILSTRHNTREIELHNFSESIIQTQECKNLFAALTTG